MKEGKKEGGRQRGEDRARERECVTERVRTIYVCLSQMYVSIDKMVV